jgi:hypothetical protein
MMAALEHGIPRILGYLTLHLYFTPDPDSAAKPHPCLKCIHTYVIREKMQSPSIEITVTGVQNRRILIGLLLSRLAAKNKAKNKTARIQHKGEKKLSSRPPAIAATPVALELLMPLKATTNPGPSTATNIAATALRTPRRVVTVCLPNRCPRILLRNRLF